MDRQDQQAAEQLSIYIDASQQGKQTPEEFPFVDQLLAVARGIEARPTLKVRMVHAMNPRQVARRHLRWVSVAAALALVLVTFMTVPALPPHLLVRLGGYISREHTIVLGGMPL